MSLEIHTLMKTINTDKEIETSTRSRVPLCPFVCVCVCVCAHVIRIFNVKSTLDKCLSAQYSVSDHRHHAVPQIFRIISS